VRLYTVHIPVGGQVPGEAPILLEEGFCWPAFFFSFLWALWHRLWLVAFLLVLAILAIETAMSQLGASDAVHGAVTLGVAVFVGASANDWRRRDLAKQGYRLTDIVAAGDEDAACRRWGDAQPGRLL
jgi:hypothetical protein